MATIKYKDKDGEWKELTVLKGDSGVAPIINPDTNTWLVWDNEQGVYIDTGVVAGVGSEDFYASTYWVFNEMASGKKVIADALTERNYPTDKSESFNDMAQKITNMSYEEGWFAKIGYTDENASALQEMIDYSYGLAKGWNPDGSTALMFRDNTKLAFSPLVDTSKCDLRFLYNSCTGLLIPTIIDGSASVGMEDLFRNCSNLRVAKFKNTSKITNMYRSFSSCSKLEQIFGLDVASLTTNGTWLEKCASLVFFDVKNIGKSSLATYDFSDASVWGTGSEENRQSLIDSLITYSYDRASSGMSVVTIKLSANTKALLTEEEIAQITNKGFTIA